MLACIDGMDIHHGVPFISALLMMYISCLLFSTAKEAHVLYHFWEFMITAKQQRQHRCVERACCLRLFLFISYLSGITAIMEKPVP